MLHSARSSPMKRLLWICLGLPGVVHALEIRGYTAAPATYDRFVNFPAAPALNSSAWWNGSTGTKFTGLGWATGVYANQRQMALVSPRHVLLPTHWPADGLIISFRNADGDIVTRTVTSSTTIKHSGALNSDLTLGRLDAPLLASHKVTPFPYDDTTVGSRQLQVFGFHRDPQTNTITNLIAGAGTISAYTPLNEVDNKGTPADPSDDVTTKTTQCIGFNYLTAAGNNDDCHFEVGDSGSPSFVTIGNGPAARPAVIGTHSYINPSISDPPPATYTNYDAYVPYYVPNLNGLMAADGYQMRPASMQSATLAIAPTITADPSPAIQNLAQSATIQISTSNREANNPTIALTFQNGQAPTSITNIDGDTGWFVDQSGPTTWLLHRASIPANSNVQLKLNWNALPAVSDIAIGVTAEAYNASSTLSTLHLTTVQPYASWSNNLPAAMKSASSDPDNDGRVNLLEYAFNNMANSATNGSQLLSNGQAAGPSAQNGAGFVEISLPVRTDSSGRGLWYRPQYSTDLSALSWTTTAPPGTTVDFVNYSPALPGFARMRIRLTQPSHFVRIGVELNESQAGMDVPITP